MSRPVTIFTFDEGWQLGLGGESEVTVVSVQTATDASLQVKALAVATQLKDMACDGTSVILAIASSWCLSAKVSTDRLERGRRRRSMMFQLEEHLPIASEQFVADFIECSGSKALGVCAELDRLERIVAALGDAGLKVIHICPQALLTAATLVEQQPDACAVVINNSRDADDACCEFDLITVEKGHPSQWRWIAGEEALLCDELESLNDPNAADRAVLWTGSPQPISRVARSVPHLRLRDESREQSCELAVLAASKILSGQSAPWIDLCRDSLAPADPMAVYRRPLTIFAVAMVILLVTVIAVTQYRAGRYEELVSEHAQAQVDLFKEALPGQRVPASIRSRLQSELQRLWAKAGPQADSGTTGDQAKIGSAVADSALESLHTVLTGLPGQIRFRINDLSIEPGLIRIDGQAQSHLDAEQIAISLEGTARLDVEPPRTQALAGGGVQFSFTAKPRVKPHPTGAQP